MPAIFKDNELQIIIDESDLNHSPRIFLDKVRNAIAESLGDVAEPIKKGDGTLEQSPVMAPLNEAINALKVALPRKTSSGDNTFANFIEAIKKKEVSGQPSYLTEINHAIEACDMQAEKHSVAMSGVKLGLEKLREAFQDAVDQVELQAGEKQANQAIGGLSVTQTAPPTVPAQAERPDPEWLVSARQRYSEEAPKLTSAVRRPWGRG